MAAAVAMAATACEGCAAGYALASRQEGEELARQFLRRLLGHMVSAIEPAPARLARPAARHREDIAIEPLDIVAARPQHEERTGEAPPGTAIGLVIRAGFCRL